MKLFEGDETAEGFLKRYQSSHLQLEIPNDQNVIKNTSSSLSNALQSTGVGPDQTEVDRTACFVEAYYLKRKKNSSLLCFFVCCCC